MINERDRMDNTIASTEKKKRNTTRKSEVRTGEIKLD